MVTKEYVGIMYYTKTDPEPENEVLDKKLSKLNHHFHTLQPPGFNPGLIPAIVFFGKPRLELLHVRVWMSIGSPLV